MIIIIIRKKNIHYNYRMKITFQFEINNLIIGQNEDRIFLDEIESFQSNDCFINGVDNPHRIPLEMVKI